MLILAIWFILAVLGIVFIVGADLALKGLFS